jgi:Homocysteine S-methyltransferase
MRLRGRRTRQPYISPVGFAVADNTVLIADGGLATELEARGHDLSYALWSARLLVDAPQEISAAHLSFFRAGAMIATTASYQASFDGFAARGIGRDETARLLRRSVQLAADARAEAGVDGAWVAASVGPYGAARADGSEYRGRYGLTVTQLEDWHRPRLEVLADAGADVLAVETIPDADEAEALVNIVRAMGVSAWLSYTVDGARTRSAVDRRVRRGGRRAGNRCGGRQLLRTRGRGRGDRPGRRHRQTGDRVPEQRRTLGRYSPQLGWHIALFARVGRAVGVSRCASGRRLLPGTTGRHRRVGGRAGLDD